MWELQFDPAHKIMDYFDNCPDVDAQKQEYIELCTKYSQDEYSPLEVGFGYYKIGPNWKVLDPYDQRPGVDYRIKLEDVSDFPELEGVFDFVLAKAVFEHVQAPSVCAMAVEYLLKPDGIFYGDFPFVFPFHPFKGYNENTHGLLAEDNLPEFKNDEKHGGDYWRYTPQTIKMLFANLDIIKLEKTVAGSFIFIGKKGI